VIWGLWVVFFQTAYGCTGLYTVILLFVYCKFVFCS